MASARGDALEWALALAHAPGERHGLRQRPLPEGMEALLQVAGGSHADAMAKAVEHAGRPAAEVVDAARFYLREMLFFPEADAYRVLGLAADASHDQIKHHHRLLQQWLHPDRPTSNWDAAFAARVNAAWSQLRTPALREAYATRRAGAGAVAERPPSWTAPPASHVRGPGVGGQMRVASPADSIDDTPWRRRAPVVALFGVCAVLGVLAVRDMQQAPEGRLGGRTMAGVTSTEVTPTLELHLPALPASDREVQAKRSVAAPSPKPGSRQGAVAAKPVARPSAVAVAAESVAMPVAFVAPGPIPPPTSVATVRQAVPAAVAPKPLATVLAPVPASVGRNARVTSVPDSTVRPVVQAATPVAVTRPPASIAAVATPALVAPRVPETAPPAAAVTTAVVVVSRPPEVPEAPTASHSPVQVAQVQRTGEQLLAFVAGSGSGMPPIWANYAAQTQASRAREALQGNGRIAVSAPDWRVGAGSAAMQASLTPRDGDAHRLRVDLVWRDQRWLVSALALEQAL